MLASDFASAPKVWVGLTGINQSSNNLLGIGIAKVLEVSPTPLEYATDEEEDDIATDASYQTPPMASASPATVPPEAVVEVPTPQVSCVCGELLKTEGNGKEFVVCVDDDGLGDVIEMESEEEHFPEENIDPLPVHAPPPAYAPVCGQQAVQGRASLSKPHRYPYTEHRHLNSDRTDLLRAVIAAQHRGTKQQWDGKNPAQNV